MQVGDCWKYAQNSVTLVTLACMQEAEDSVLLHGVAQKGGKGGRPGYHPPSLGACRAKHGRPCNVACLLDALKGPPVSTRGTNFWA